MDTFDPKHLSLSQSTFIPAIKQSNPPNTNVPRHQIGENFLKGPIPLKLISRATQLPGKAWHVYAAIWYLVGIKKSRTIKLSQQVLNEFCVNRFAKYRALEALAKAGLIRYQSNDGKNPLVTLMHSD
jgi:hypothetical protein